MGDMRVTSNGGFIVGVAYNQHYGYDFGDQVKVQTNQGVTPGPLGLDQPKQQAKMMSDFQKLAANGVNTVSIKLFADGRTGIDFDPKNPGRAIKVQESVYRGLDNVMTAASANGIAVQLVLFDHLFAESAAKLVESTKDVHQTGQESKQGHLTAFTDAANREQLLQNVIAPVLQYLGSNPNLLSVELINEPESILASMHGTLQKNIPQSQTEVFKDYMRTVRDLVHDTTGAQFTVGSMGVGFVKQWLDVIDPAQDYLSIHYYENASNRDPRYASLYGPKTDIAQLQRAGVPLIFGEFAANGYGKKIGAEQFLEDARAHGIRGGIAWAMYDADGNLGEKQPKGGTANFGRIPLDDFRHFRLLNPGLVRRVSAPQPRQGGLFQRLLNAVAEFGTSPTVPKRFEPAAAKATVGRYPLLPRNSPGLPTKTRNLRTLNNVFSPTNPFSPLNPMNPANPTSPLNPNNPFNPASHGYRQRMERLRNVGHPHFGGVHVPGVHANPSHPSNHKFGPIHTGGGTHFGAPTRHGQGQHSGPPTLVHGPSVHIPPHRQAWHAIHRPGSFGHGQTHMTISLSDIHRQQHPPHRATHHNQPTRVLPPGGWNPGYNCC
jgi:hypothetical protein